MNTHPTPPACPKCGLENTYADGDNYICPDCAFEWPAAANAGDDEAESADGVVRDSNGNPLADGDAWDAGVALSVAGLQGFRPRRATLVVVEQARLSPEDGKVLSQLEQQAWNWPRAVRVVLVGGEPPVQARPLGV